jgi:hypothetical protein
VSQRRWLMFVGVRDKSTLLVLVLRMHDLEKKILNGETLTEKEAKELKLCLQVRGFRDDRHRRQLIKQFWKEAKILNKKFKEEKA